MAPRTGPRVKVISPNSGTITTLSRSVSMSSSVYNSAHTSPASSVLRRHCGGGPHADPNEEESYARYTPTVSVTPPPPQSGRAVLRALGINTTAASTASAMKGASRTAPPPPPPSTSMRSDLPSHHSHNSSNTTTQGGGLPDYFAEAKQRKASRAAPTRPAQPSFSSASRSTSRGLHTHGQRARSRAEDDEAIHRARAALEHAGDAVLRRPFSSLHTSASSANTSTHNSSNNNSSINNKSASTLLGGNASSLPLRVTSTLPNGKHRGMRLPPSIPITRAASRGSEDEQDSDGADERFNASHKRSRSWADATENAAALARRRTAPATAQTSESLSSVPQSGGGGNGSASSTLMESRRVCPGMFAGVSAIPLDPRLFDGIEPHRLAATSSSSSSSTQQAQGRRRDTVSSGGGSSAQQRYCVRPLWSLVGTFKTSLSGLVAVDFHHDCLRWSQRNPKGGQQCIHVPLSHILDVFTTKVVQEDDNIEERQFTVVVRTSTRPSQVVFGFATVTEANHMRAVLKRP